MGPVTFATDNNIRSGAVSDREAEAGILPSHGISLDVPGYDGAEGGRPALIQHM
jgi:[calcium/calmodulin-dependent protein kinase] kinase